MARNLAVLAVGVFLAAGCLRWPGPTGSPRVMKLVGGEKPYEMVRIPALARVEAHLGPDGAGSGPYRIPDADLKRLSDLLCDDATYVDSASTTRGTFRPDAVVMFRGWGREEVRFNFAYAIAEVRTFDGMKQVGSAAMRPERMDEVKRILESLRKAYFH